MFANSSLVIDGKIIVGMAGENAWQSLHTDVIFVNFWGLKLLGWMYNFFRQLAILKYYW